ncbi:MAG: hypothetical protein NVS4B8_05680 [Herpetosiphon sp.]
MAVVPRPTAPATSTVAVAPPLPVSELRGWATSFCAVGAATGFPVWTGVAFRSLGRSDDPPISVVPVGTLGRGLPVGTPGPTSDDGIDTTARRVATGTRVRRASAAVGVAARGSTVTVSCGTRVSAGEVLVGNAVASCPTTRGEGVPGTTVIGSPVGVADGGAAAGSRAGTADGGLFSGPSVGTT